MISLRAMKLHIFLLFGAILFSCKKDDPNGLPISTSTSTYSARGVVLDSNSTGISGIEIFLNEAEFVLTDSNGNWSISDLVGQQTITPVSEEYYFNPSYIGLNGNNNNLVFTATKSIQLNESNVFHWFDNQQLPNGLLESVENGNFVSLYDNALAVMVYLINEDFDKAEKVLDYFNARISIELKEGVGGFFQFRSRNGNPSGNRWMGDNAWLLIAINNYKVKTGSSKFEQLAAELNFWLRGLQDTDGGLFAGYKSDGSSLDYKVTEGMIDAFNAIEGYDTFHIQLLDFLEKDRWNAADKNLMAWPENPPYRYALDCHSWSYCIFEDYPVSSITSATRFRTTKTATLNNVSLIGFDIDQDRDAIFMEGSGQMALAYNLAGLFDDAEFYLAEMEKLLIQSTGNPNSASFPYSSNRGTSYGSEPLWEGADLNIAISPGAWYIFAKTDFNPFAVGRSKNMPENDKFWAN